MKGFIWLALAGAAWPSPITFTISANGSGTLNGVPFTDEAITFTQVTDTSLIGANCFGEPGTYCSPVSTSNTVTIGSATYTLTDSTVFEVGNDVGGIVDRISGADSLDEDDPAFLTYNMQSSLGPIVDSINAASPGPPEPTSGGSLALAYNSSAFFTATASSAPEPGTFALILAGSILLVRRKLKQ